MILEKVFAMTGFIVISTSQIIGFSEKLSNVLRPELIKNAVSVADMHTRPIVDVDALTFSPKSKIAAKEKTYPLAESRNYITEFKNSELQKMVWEEKLGSHQDLAQEIAEDISKIQERKSEQKEIEEKNNDIFDYKLMTQEPPKDKNSSPKENRTGELENSKGSSEGSEEKIPESENKYFRNQIVATPESEILRKSENLNGNDMNNEKQKGIQAENLPNKNVEAEENFVSAKNEMPSQDKGTELKNDNVSHRGNISKQDSVSQKETTPDKSETLDKNIAHNKDVSGERDNNRLKGETQPEQAQNTNNKKGREQLQDEGQKNPKDNNHDKNEENQALLESGEKKALPSAERKALPEGRSHNMYYGY